MTTPPQQPPPPPPAGSGGPPAGYANNEEKTWALVAHFGGGGAMFLLGAVLGWVPPLIALLAKGNQSPTVRAHAVNALNFQITWSAVALIGWALVCILIGFLFVIAAYVVGIVFSIIAGIKANEGEVYDYKAAIKLVK